MTEFIPFAAAALKRLGISAKISLTVGIILSFSSCVAKTATLTARVRASNSTDGFLRLPRISVCRSKMLRLSKRGLAPCQQAFSVPGESEVVSGPRERSRGDEVNTPDARRATG